MISSGYKLLIALPIVLLFSCGDDNITGSGRYVDVDYPMRDISRVAAYDGFDIDITVDDTTAVSVRMDDNIIGNVKVHQDTNTVRFRLDDKGRNLRSIFYHGYVTVPFLKSVTLTDGSTASITHANNEVRDFECVLDRGSEMVGTLKMRVCDLSATGASTVTLGGEAASASLTIDGNSVIDLRDFPIIDCTILVDGESKVYVTATGSLSVNIRGKSEVYYYGEPHIRDIHIEPGCVFDKM